MEIGSGRGHANIDRFIRSGVLFQKKNFNIQVLFYFFFFFWWGGVVSELSHTKVYLSAQSKSKPSLPCEMGVISWAMASENYVAAGGSLATANVSPCLRRASQPQH